MKKKKIMLLALGIMGVLPLMAQGSRHFTIDGEMTRDSMRYEPKAIQKVYLKHIVNGEEVLLDSAIVKNRRFHFEGTAPEFTEAAMITGFDNGAVQLLLEPGNIKVLPFDAHFPTGAKAEERLTMTYSRGMSCCTARMLMMQNAISTICASLCLIASSRMT